MRVGRSAIAAAIWTLGACAVSFPQYSESEGVIGGGSSSSTTSSSSSTSTATSTASSASGTGGAGGGCNKASDCPAPQDPCWTATCTASVCGKAPSTKGMACSAGGGTVCDGAGQCVACVTNADCKDATKPVCDAGACKPYPSCRGGGTGAGVDCGPSNDADCCASLLVTGGTFPMGRSTSGADSYAGNADELPEHNATVGSFRLDRFEVTVGRFRQFVNAGTSTQPNPPTAGSGKDPNLIPADTGWQASLNGNLAMNVGQLENLLACDPTFQTWTDSAAGHEKRPINCVTWYEAVAFCAWDGGWLPTEAEWEYAAAGGTDNRLFPWSSPPNSAQASCKYANYYGGNSTYCSPTTYTNDVGSDSPMGDGKYGQSDLGGNVWEWTLDWYSSTWYAGGGNACNNCADLTPAMYHVVRGGYFNDLIDVLRAVYRGADMTSAPGSRTKGVGFRCARAP